MAGSVLVMTGLGATACVPLGTVCTAVGYPSLAQVTLAEPREGVSLQLCDGEDCGLGAPTWPGSTGSSHDMREDGIGMISLTGDDLDGWTADFIGGQPVVGYRLTDFAGEVIGEGSVDVEWVRMGGTEECGGPREAEIELPA